MNIVVLRGAFEFTLDVIVGNLYTRYSEFYDEVQKKSLILKFKLRYMRKFWRFVWPGWITKWDYIINLSQNNTATK